MEKSNRIERSEVWKSIYEVVKQIPRKEVGGDAVDAPSAATEIEELFLKLLPIQNVSKVEDFICPLCNILAPITKVIYECKCGVKHEAQINDEVAVCACGKFIELVDNTQCKKCQAESSETKAN